MMYRQSKQMDKLLDAIEPWFDYQSKDHIEGTPFPLVENAPKNILDLYEHLCKLVKKEPKF